ncbi:fibrinogen-like protein A [Physella acuta]|uniref:fibrinogen-like protein A n=1 Tax=Physella acuta TaxID=109671 RepID=UPI0027DBDB9B|nr:fibrinogen-like protein A [Physella acuta]
MEYNFLAFLFILNSLAVHCEVANYEYVATNRTGLKMLPLAEHHVTSTMINCASKCAISKNDCRNLMYDQTTGVCTLGHWMIPENRVDVSVPQPPPEAKYFSLDKTFCQVNETVNFIGNEQNSVIVNKSNVIYNTSTYKSCMDLRNSSNPRQLLQLSSGLVVMCDTVTDGGGWTIFQRRVSGVVDFYRNWEEYKHGFGDFDAGEFYLGNENIYCLLNRSHELRVDFTYLGQTYYVSYSVFKLSNESEFYRLYLSGFSGNGTRILEDNSNRWFATYDRAYDSSGIYCATWLQGGWWYSGCGYTNLNGVWSNREFMKGLIWYYITQDKNRINTSEMKIRPL